MHKEHNDVIGITINGILEEEIGLPLNSKLFDQNFRIAGSWPVYVANNLRIYNLYIPVEFYLNDLYNYNLFNYIKSYFTV